MPKLRIVHNNLADSPNTLITPSSIFSSTAGATNLKKDSKSLVWKSALATTSSVAASLVVSFGDTMQTVKMVALPFTNLTSAATMRIKGYVSGRPNHGGTVDVPTTTYTAQTINDIVYAAGKFVGVGSSGLVTTSTDGNTWTYSANISNSPMWPVGFSLGGVAYGNGIFVAGGTNGYIATSTDGISWDINPALSNNTSSWSAQSIYCVRFLNNKFVIVGNSGRLAHSTDGITWTVANPSILSGSGIIYQIAYNGLTGGSERYMVVASSGRTAITSDFTSAASWTLSTISTTAPSWSTNAVYCVTYHSATSRWIIGGQNACTAYSADNGSTWTFVAADGVTWTSTLEVRAVLSTGTNIIKIGQSGRSAYSTDGGSTWILATTPLTSPWGTNTGMMLLSALGAVYATGTSGRVGATTDNGITWSNRPSTSSAAAVPVAAVYDSGAISCCAWNVLDIGSLSTDAAGVSKYSYGGGTYAVVWLPTSMHVPVYSISIEITDTRTGEDKYIEASRLILGSYWEPKFNLSYGLSTNIKDLSEHERTESGDLVTEKRPIFNTMKFDLRVVDSTDVAPLTQILIGSGKTKPIFISAFPEAGTSAANREKERAHMLYGKLSQMPGLENFALDYYSTQVEVEEI